VEHDAAQELDVIMTLPDGATGRFADDGVGLRQQVVQRLTAVKAGSEFTGLGPQLIRTERSDCWLQSIDPSDQGTKFLYFMFGALAEQST
jgi:hypothetical protein